MKNNFNFFKKRMIGENMSAIFVISHIIMHPTLKNINQLIIPFSIKNKLL